MSASLQRLSPGEVLVERRLPVDIEALGVAAEVIERVRRDGEVAVRRYAEQFGDVAAGASLVVERAQLMAALQSLPSAQRELLERVAARIRAFAEAQRACLLPLDTAVPGGRAGHRWLPVHSVGAYAPGGRHPLPSSVLMTTIPARVAGVREVVVASPRPTQVTLAAAAVAGADRLLAVGGAQAVAALAFGVFGAPAHVVVGPGNRYVTAAKRCLVGEVGIDGLAGPSELVVVADADARADVIAADLLGQAEHDDDACPVLVTTAWSLIAEVEGELERQLATLPTAATARAALRHNGRAVLCRDLDEVVAVVDALAPEHLQLCCTDAEALAPRFTAYGGLFVGAGAAEVFGDYGAGPNHVLPTGRGARFQAGLSVATFLRPATWLRLDDPTQLLDDTAALARLEGLEGHARAAEVRAEA